MTVLPVLLALLRPRLDRPTYEWLCATLDLTVAPLDARAFRIAWSRVGRRLGSEPVTPTAEEVAQLQAVGVTPFVGWGADECARAALLVQAVAVTPLEAHGPLLDSLYMRGTIRERRALLRTLAFLPEPERYEDLAQHAARSHVLPVFEALAIANPYPARYFSRARFDQMVLRALSFRIAPERIVGLADRMSAESPRPRAPAGPRWGPEVSRMALRAP